MPPLPYILAITLILLTTATLRLIYILPALHRRRPAPRKRGTPTHLLIVLGSGGHTAEMLSLLAPLNPAHYTYRTYVTGSGDDFSAERAHEFERRLVAKNAEEKEKSEPVSLAHRDGKGTTGISRSDYSIHTVPRARQIHQSLLSSPLSSLRCLCACLRLLYWHPNGYPDLILTNGPATSLILILAATILRYFAFLPVVGPAAQSARGRTVSGTMRVVYVESWARVKRPSLSGRIIVWCGLCDRMLVQWKGLQDRGWGEYKGVLVR
ncbi:UDP-N-acetylglucosamine transferase subunit [Imshaugia aleurites]|uniref:UDP-N-acetylglucosamine transferase subunit ALG14 n=1 Tax=Imshaugia aleurites TaxID=172621 RepID=A0A8H3F1Y3_9LECA|nr:UDP-N-acetylglucosamine transferase subunit [Imshaugia aleurites]